ncbi:ABC-ATPase domain-containing protein [Crassaminicella profunda]|uniref:ABC-ATPase domain-containing protein n=1 Tax=Crassaminicella profunda TaxID=1286698 RepID=UPI001CA69ED5|nr:ABC-ATPase domain-containing protein [Crassaminicella profunda]QZY56379.1 ABC-ATPase domain-containing protein [Crassaminicella profunda]
MELLRKKLNQIDGRGYKAYKDIQGTYKGEAFLLHIDHVQADPFASPSRIRVEFSKDIVKFEERFYETKYRKIAFEDFFAREAAKNIQSYSTNKSGSGKSGLILIDAPSQEILQRTAVKIDHQKIEFRLSLGLPARGRTILGKQAIKLLCDHIPHLLKKAVFEYNKKQLINHLELTDQQQTIRKFLNENKYICFLGNGSILPRESGISNKPLNNDEVVPFVSPSSLEIEIPIPHSEPIRGMAIPEGITLIVGGGYHGKSTLLKAMERGIYNHILGDGREYVITNPTAFKIRAEDGRRVEKVNISPFINNLPFNKDTTRFSTEDASGSTSQATNIVESLEMGSKVLLIDEDTSATNFMIRDGRMQELVGKEKEPITPFIDKARQLYENHKVSTILVIGGSGDYFHIADRIIMLDEYKAIDVTKKGKDIAKRFEHIRKTEGGKDFGEISHRIIKNQSFNASRGKKEKVDAKGLHTIIYGTSNIDLSFVEQLIDPSQTRAIALMIKYLSKNLVDNTTPLSVLIEKLYAQIEKNGLEVISPYTGKHPGNLALPRKFELSAAINRLRTLKVK